MCLGSVAVNQVFVMLFGVGQKDTTEGIYSLRAVAADGMPTETIIAFESEDDAERCGGRGLRTTCYKAVVLHVLHAGASYHNACRHLI